MSGPSKGTPDGASPTTPLKYEVDGHTVTVTLNRPDRPQRAQPFHDHRAARCVRRAENDDNIWLLIVTGAGRAFCTGADAKQIPEDGKVINETALPVDLRPVGGAAGGHAAVSPEWPSRCWRPINGICCGAGLDWVTTGDIVIASDKATFFDPHVTIGLVAGREMVRLARVLPRNIALRMALVGKHERMMRQRAYDLGLISEVVEHDAYSSEHTRSPTS
jgi:enoyl-CoA hydratase/carnithine racemase